MIPRWGCLDVFLIRLGDKRRYQGCGGLSAVMGTELVRRLLLSALTDRLGRRDSNEELDGKSDSIGRWHEILYKSVYMHIVVQL